MTSCDPQLSDQRTHRASRALQRHLTPGEPSLCHSLPDTGEGTTYSVYTVRSACALVHEKIRWTIAKRHTADSCFELVGSHQCIIYSGIHMGLYTQLSSCGSELHVTACIYMYLYQNTVRDMTLIIVAPLTMNPPCL